MKVMLATGILVLCVQYALASVLLGPEDQVVPLGAANVTFTCRTAGELRWKVLLFVVSPAIEGDVDLLRRQGICMQDLLINNSTSPQQYTSTLVVKQPEDYNGSVITCGNPDPNSRARQSIINGQQAIVLVFGPPVSAPSQLSAAPALLSLTLQWSAPFAPYNTSLQYELHITEVNSKSGAMAVTLNETQYNLTRTEKKCAIFHFQVAAFNTAGRGPNSTVLTASLPSAPSASNIAGSTTHQLYLTSSGELRCQISAKPAEYCADYPVESYSVVLTQGSSGSSWTSGPFSQSGDRLEISLDSTSNITENDNYTYLIRAHNSIGYDDSEELSFYTTDVQRPVFALVDNTTLKVRCAFIERSRARGCVAKLRLHIGSVAVNVTRQNISGHDIAVVNLTITVTTSSSSSSSAGGGGGGGGEGLVVYDWEEDGSRGELAIPVPPCQQVELAACFPEIYNTTTHDLSPKPTTAALIGGVAAGTALAVIAVGSILCLIALRVKNCRSHTASVTVEGTIELETNTAYATSQTCHRTHSRPAQHTTSPVPTAVPVYESIPGDTALASPADIHLETNTAYSMSLPSRRVRPPQQTSAVGCTTTGPLYEDVV